MFSVQLRRFAQDVEPARAAVEEASDAMRPPFFVAEIDASAAADERGVISLAQLLELLILVVWRVYVGRFDIDQGKTCRSRPPIDLVELLNRAAAVLIDRVSALLEPLISIGAFSRYELLKGG